MSTTSDRQNIIICDRKSIEMNGVYAVLEFDDKYVGLDTSKGRLHIEGEEMKIEDLSRESNKIFITGDIISIAFDTVKKSKKDR